MILRGFCLDDGKADPKRFSSERGTTNALENGEVPLVFRDGKCFLRAPGHVFFVKPRSGVAGVAGGGVSTAGHSFKNPFVEGYCDDAVLSLVGHFNSQQGCPAAPANRKTSNHGLAKTPREGRCTAGTTLYNL